MVKKQQAPNTPGAAERGGRGRRDNDSGAHGLQGAQDHTET